MFIRVKKLFKIWRIKSELKGLYMLIEEVNRKIYSDRCELNDMKSKIMHGKRDVSYYEKEMKEINESIDKFDNMKLNIYEKIDSLELELNMLRNK